MAPIATGGMAEILLAAADGAEGFTRPVVIKRVLPHLARTPEFRTMFIDEARMLATLRHPNVVTVETLGEEDEALYLVMEYLEGEGLDAVVKALSAQQTRLAPALAAQVIAEACAGLHAAHEHRDVQGRPLEIVHRDVSPQNLFVTYAGAVKVIDFGIAQAKDRETKTETGTVKGKFAYMSPEQIEGGEVDRRTDVFALGVVLHELLTGRRLYQRKNHLEIVRAICLTPTPRPTAWQPDVPPGLEAVVMRALSKSPAERQPSALVLREELRREIAGLGPPPDLAQTMQALFAERRRDKGTMLREALRAQATPTPISRVSAASAGAATEMAPEAPHVRRASVARLRALVVGALVVGTLALGALVVGALALGAMALAPFSLDASSREAASPSIDGGASPAGEPPTSEPAPRDAGPIEAARAAPLDAGLREIRLTITSTPSGATVRLDGEVLGTTPFEESVARSTTERHLVLEREGYRPLERPLIPDVDQRLELTLSRLPRGGRPPVTPPTETPAPSPSPFGRVD